MLGTRREVNAVDVFGKTVRGCKLGTRQEVSIYDVRITSCGSWASFLALIFWLWSVYCMTGNENQEVDACDVSDIA